MFQVERCPAFAVLVHANAMSPREEEEPAAAVDDLLGDLLSVRSSCQEPVLPGPPRGI